MWCVGMVGVSVLGAGQAPDLRPVLAGVSFWRIMVARAARPGLSSFLHLVVRSWLCFSAGWVGVVRWGVLW